MLDGAGLTGGGGADGADGGESTEGGDVGLTCGAEVVAPHPTISATAPAKKITERVDTISSTMRQHDSFNVAPEARPCVRNSRATFGPCPGGREIRTLSLHLLTLR